MTCREKLAFDHPEWRKSYYEWYLENCCPDEYLAEPEYCHAGIESKCKRCWEREVPGTIDLMEEKSMTTKKTKAELMEEIAVLEKQVNELEKYKTYRDCGDDLKAIHTEFMNAGFSNEQAFHLLQTMMQTSAMNNAIDTIKAVTGRR